MKRIGRLLLAGAGLSLCGSHPAPASETIICGALDGSDAQVELNVGRALFTLPSWVRVIDGDREWSTLGDEGATPVTIAQAFHQPDLLSIDIADDVVSEVLIRIRLLHVEEGERGHDIGYLHILGRAVHPIGCDLNY